MNTTTQAGEAPNLLELIKRFMEAGWRRRYLICVPIVLMIPLGLMAARMAPKTYEAKTILLLQEPSTGNPFLDDYAIGLNLKERMGALRSLLRSEHIMLGVLRDMGRLDEKATPAAVAFEVRRLAEAVSVDLAGGSLIELRLSGNTPEGMGALLKAITDRFLDQLLSPEKSRLEATRSFLKQQMSAQLEELQALEARLASLRRAHEDKLAEPPEARSRQLARLEEQLRSARAQLAAARIEVKSARSQIVSGNSGIRELDRRIAEAQGELALLGARYTAEHSKFAAVEQQLSQLERQRRQLAAQIGSERDRSGPETAIEGATEVPAAQLDELHRAQARAASKAKEVEELESRVAELREMLGGIEPLRAKEQALKAEVAQARSRYDALSERFDNASISYALGQFQAPERVKIIDPPADPKAPVTPPGIIYLVASLFGGISLGIGLALTMELLDQRLRTARDFAAVSDANILARLPRVNGAS